MMKHAWAALVVGVFVSTTFVSESHAQQSSPGVKTYYGFKPLGPVSRRATPGRCTHRPDCEYCCYYPDSQSTTCTFDIKWCGR